MDGTRALIRWWLAEVELREAAKAVRRHGPGSAARYAAARVEMLAAVEAAARLTTHVMSPRGD